MVTVSKKGLAKNMYKQQKCCQALFTFTAIVGQWSMDTMLAGTSPQHAVLQSYALRQDALIAVLAC